MHKSLWLSLVLAFFSVASTPSWAESRVQAEPVQAVAAQLDLNSADAAQLQQALTGVGVVKAQAIIDYRNAHGAFTSVDELLEVKGIGAATLEKNRDRLVVR